ncbi:3-dehydroquinate synthase [Vulcanibacillus modesticaldus]|uniref:3-dehydroquinate synthase n=1 Tax=Vulcanibacillus modesticaldus TaxID=337097 RepID=A0A1D2YTM2_9BACI|nr:3-dehydroquinate synthase [Vulcanibacillus modesticaldus]OEF99026.1 3-dehydroquinate synthase [Vulcanibacillus modesticaldus]
MKEMIIQVSQEKYPIVIGSNIYDQLPNYLTKVGITEKSKILIITDNNVADFHLHKIMNILDEYDTYSYIVPAGEYSKSMKQVEKIIEYALLKGLDRFSTIIALGGGVVGDLAGFIAAIYMRGISFIQCPTTILAHDSSVGGKVGINHPLGKNLIGAFYQPKLVFYDTSFLHTLPRRQVLSGFAEVIKHGLIANAEFTNWLGTNVNSLLALEHDYVIEALYKGIGVKAAIVRKDEKELGVRAFLNYGHTLAHAIETISDYQYLHGEAVAIGMVFASKLAYEIGIASNEVVKLTENLIHSFSLPIRVKEKYDPNRLVEIMMRDKKFKNNQIRMILPTAIGNVVIKENIDRRQIVDLLQEFIK